MRRTAEVGVVDFRQMLVAYVASAFFCGFFGVDWWQTVLILAPFVVVWRLAS